jgi:hypothetical protein
MFSAGGVSHDIDLLTQVEGSHASKPSYGAITSRSYHAGDLVTSLFMDGSVRPIPSGIDLKVWRALGTRAGREIDTDF